MKAKLFYIKERHNPQFKKPYYVALGQLTKIDAHKQGKSIYGDNIIHSYDTEKEYNVALEEFKAQGFSVH